MNTLRLLLLSTLAVLLAGTVSAQETHPRNAWGVWGAPCAGADRRDCSGLTADPDERKLRRVAQKIAARSGGSAEEVIQRLQRLLRLPGSALYLEIDRSGPFDVVLQPTRSKRLYIPIEPDAYRTGEFRGEFISAETGRGPDEVYTFWIEGTTQGEYVVEVPSAVSYVTLVVNGRIVAAEQPVDPTGRPVTVPAGR